MLTNVFLRS